MVLGFPLRSAGFALILTLSGLLVAAGCSEQEEAAPAPPRAVRVMEINPAESPLASVEGTGRIEARTTSDVGFLVTGRLIERRIDTGDVVKTGDLLARIDPTDYQNRLTAAAAQVTSARAGVDQATPQEARMKKLLDDGFTTRQQYESALQALQGAQASLESAEANLKLAQDQLKYTQLVAPTDGVITQTGADVGQVVSAGQMVVQLARHGEREAVFAVAPRHVPYAHTGMPVSVWLQGKPSEMTRGEIREIAPDADPTTGTYNVKVSLPDAPDDMRLGAIVVGRAEVPGGLFVRIPTSALLQTGDTPAVWVASEADGTVARRPVDVLRYETDGVIIKGGIEKGDLVVVAGVNSLAEGQHVSVQKVAVQ
ncbi:efflux RND transporter periplasmic adaptor subunit [Mesorhizobium xinjiangense]|uniref:efflux RND transporter periplasmic adaptor subunit n=1 Tax=Mesorhizobium xinjiangense TaxID=2678685 RepID=UPI0012EDF0E5|nr:efflux RND transporter periplasmic adaptor subunit [Mesorhizobium xinjiangense]